MRRQNKRKMKKKGNAKKPFLLKYLNMLEDLLKEGYSLNESKRILLSKISKSGDKVKISEVVKESKKISRNVEEDYEVDFFYEIFNS